MLRLNNFYEQKSSLQNLNKNNIINYWNSSSVSLVILSSMLGVKPLNAQEINLVGIKNRETETIKLENSEDNVLIVSTPPAESTEHPEISIPTTDEVPEKIVVENFNVVGSSVFSQEELTNAIKSYQNRPLSLPELFQARSAITKLYTDKGYINSGAYIPPQELNKGTVKIAVLEGKLEGINVTGTKHLNQSYIEKRIKSAANVPVNIDSLLEALQLLRLDPLIANVSAELSAGVRPGTSLLDIEVQEADVFNLTASYNNERSPSVGTIQRSIGLNYGNVLGFGDQFNFNYTNTKGSNNFDFAYEFPVNAKNGTFRMAYGSNSNEIIEEPFTPLDIESESRYYELNFRQPILLKPEQEFALGLSFSRQESETFLFNNTPYPLSRGANADGETRISSIRFYQEYVNRDETKVFALRSQFSVGVDIFNPTINDNAPDSTFFAWRGQSQWVRSLGEDFLFLLRGDVQLAGSGLVPLEQFRIGGVDSVRGYRQDLSLGDNGAFASAELRIPLFRISRIDGLVQLTTFSDIGTVWNKDDLDIENSILPSVGLGLNFAAGERFNARLDWGIPLTDVENQSGSLQEDGVYFSLDYSFF